MRILTFTATVLLLAVPAFAEDCVSFHLAESDEFGQYLTDRAGRPVYVFSTDSRTTDDQTAQVSCTSAECLEVWSPVTTASAPQPGEGVGASLLGATEHDAHLVATFDGWPLYYFVHDEGAEAPQGHEVEAFGGKWFLVNPAQTIAASDNVAGEILFADACAQCHGRTGQGMASFPTVAGRDAEYIAGKLVRYRAGETIGPNSALMFPVAAELTDENIANLAAFISGEFR